MNTNINLKELRLKIGAEDIKKILMRYGVSPHYENDRCLIYPTICHNLTGGSNKLYYYKQTHLFRCYTECDTSFDIFELIQKIEALRDNPISLPAAVKLCGYNPNSLLNAAKYDVQKDVNTLYNLLHLKSVKQPLPKLDKGILERYLVDTNALQVWVNENISLNTLNKFNIRYDPIDNCIVIPNYDIDGNLISIRGRYLNDGATAKYKPIIYGGKVLSHPSSLSLYGIYENKQYIQQMQKVILFEGEKSVLKFEDCYPNQNCAVATLGKNISKQQIELLLKLGVREVILAYDADYNDWNSLENKRKEYLKLAKGLKTYFNVCILMDLDMNLLGYKDSPIDCGKDKFEKILKNRIYV